MADELANELAALVERSPRLMTVLQVVRQQALPDALVFSGAVYQTVWNALTDRPACYGITDYDVGYYDPDTSFTAEDAVIRGMAAALEPPLRDLVEVRNQARVHLWFPHKFGHAYPPLHTTAEALRRFVCPAFAVGVRLESDGRLTVEAPFGLDDVFGMRLRVNRERGTAADWDRIITGLVERWPELVVETRE